MRYTIKVRIKVRGRITQEIITCIRQEEDYRVFEDNMDYLREHGHIIWAHEVNGDELTVYMEKKE